jgi:hypothetical protein
MSAGSGDTPPESSPSSPAPPPAEAPIPPPADPPKPKRVETTSADFRSWCESRSPAPPPAPAPASDALEPPKPKRVETTSADFRSWCDSRGPSPAPTFTDLLPAKFFSPPPPPSSPPPDPVPEPIPEAIPEAPPDAPPKPKRVETTSADFRSWCESRQPPATASASEAPPADKPKRVETTSADFRSWCEARPAASAPVSAPPPLPPAPETPPPPPSEPALVEPPPPVAAEPVLVGAGVGADVDAGVSEGGEPMPPPPGRRARVMRWLGTAGAAFFGMILLVGAYGKGIDPVSHEELIHEYRLDFWVPASVLTYAALAAEVGLGLALVLGVRRLWVLLPSVALLGLFLFLTGREYYDVAVNGADASKSCGCFGRLVDHTPAEAFWRDVLTMVPSLTLAFFGRVPGAFPWKRTIAVGALTGGALVFNSMAADLPLDALATNLKPGVKVADLCFGRGDKKLCLPGVLVDVESGKHYVVLARLDDPAFVEKVPALSDAFMNGPIDRGTTLRVLTPATPEEIQGFDMLHGAPNDMIVHAPTELLRPLYRRLPRSFLVVDGVVTETYSGFPPLPNPPPG